MGCKAYLSDFGWSLCSCDLASPEVPEQVPSQGGPKAFSWVLDCQDGDVSEGLVGEQQEVRGEAKYRDELHRGLEPLGTSPLRHAMPKVELTGRRWGSG